MDNTFTVILATYKLDEGMMRKFIDWNKEQFLRNSVRIVMVCDRDIDFGLDWVKTIKYPVELNTFALSKTINYGIKRIEGDGIIVKTDVDIYFTDEVIQHIKNNVRYKRAMVCICANRKSLQDVKTASWCLCAKRTAGRGACFAMTRQDWFDFRGYNEDIVGWGGEDLEMYRRVASRIELVENYDCPLYHVNHPDRRSNNSKYWFINSNLNMRIGKPMNWERDNWGEAVEK